MEWFIGGVVAIAFVWWVSARGESERNKARATAARFVEVEREPEPRPKSPNEKLEDSVHALREALQEKATADAQSLRDQLEDANERLAGARQLAKRLGIDTAIAAIAEEMRHWSSWSKQVSYDFSQNLVEGLRYIGGEGSVNEFEMCGTLYRLTRSNEHYGMESTAYADVLLEQGDGTTLHPVLAVEMMQDISREFSPWEVFNVTRIEVGDWVQHMVMLDELFSARRERERLAMQLQYTLPKAKHLKQ